MRAILLIARRDLGSFLRTWSGYIIMAAVLALLGLAFNAGVLGRGAQRSSEVLSNYFWWASGFTMVESVLISMRLLAEERQTGTLALLYSSPVRDSEIVIGKFLSALGFLGLFLLITLYLPALIFVHGKVSFGHIFAGYAGLFLLGSAILAVGTLGSALSKSQLVAVILSGCMVVGLLLTWWLVGVTERPLSSVFNALAPYPHFKPFQEGLFHLRDAVYFLLVTYVALFGATRVLEARRWK